MSHNSPLHQAMKTSSNTRTQSLSSKIDPLTSLLISIFFFSGFSCLIYQIVWQRVLTLYYGIGSISLTLIISVFMFGLGVGGLLGGYFAERVRDRLVLYFIIELLTGCFGMLSLPFLNFLGSTTSGSSHVMSFLYMALFLCLPTILMGTTLPLLVKIFNRHVNDFFRTVSKLYFINTIGAAAGALFASYILISFFGFQMAVYGASIINFILAIFIYSCKYIPARVEPQTNELQEGELANSSIGNLAYILVFITGILAIGYEIVSLRVICMLVKVSPYAFSSALFLFLTGIALGSIGMNSYIKHKHNDRKSLYFLLQFFIGFYILIVFILYYYLTRHTSLDILTKISFRNQLHPHFVSPSLVLSLITSPKTLAYTLYNLLDIFFWPGIFLFIPALFMGAGFPLISSLALRNCDREGFTVGRIYFFNILGNVLGGICTGFLFLPYLGTERTLLAFAVTGLLFGLMARFAGNKRITFRERFCAVLLLIATGIAVFPGNGDLYLAIHPKHGESYKTYIEEGIDGVVVTFNQKNTVHNYINGIPQGGRPLFYFYYNAVEAILFSRKVENVLVIGYGTGTATEMVLRMPSVHNVTVVEISKTLMSNLIKIPLFQDLLADDRLQLEIDDGRRFLLRTDKKYDLVLMDPLYTTTAYSNNIYSHEFFKLVSSRLNDHGIFMVWTDEHKVIPKTLLSVFTHVREYVYFLLGSNLPFQLNDNHKEYLMNEFTDQELRGLSKYINKSYVGDEIRIKDTTCDYPINRDFHPVCEYYLGLKVMLSHHLTLTEPQFP